jgi:hypothetical protein
LVARRPPPRRCRRLRKNAVFPTFLKNVATFCKILTKNSWWNQHFLKML